MHPAFNERSLVYDFALVHLEKTFELDDHIQPICLPAQFQDEFTIFKTDYCFVMGYGKDAFGRTGDYQQILKQALMSPVDHNACQNAYRTVERPGFILDNSFMCGQGVGKGTCTGDGGSPFVCPNESGHYVQVGIVAWGAKGCDGTKPDAFADVSAGLGFIDWATKCVEGQDTDYYGLIGFQRWAKRQYCMKKKRIADIKSQLDTQLDAAIEGQLRREWLINVRANKKFKKAISQCLTGPQDEDINCSINDYIEDFQDFLDYEQLEDDREENCNEQNLDYNDLLRNDVGDLLEIRSPFRD